MVAVSRVIERPFFVDDANTGFVGANGHFFDIRRRFACCLHLFIERHRRFNCRLGVELRREGDFEQHIFHDVRTVRALEAERFTFEGDVVEAPHRRSQG